MSESATEGSTTDVEFSEEAQKLAKIGDAGVAEAPLLEPGEEPDYAPGETSPEGEVRTVRIFGREVPVGLLTELADPRCPSCWTSHGTPLQGSYVATRLVDGRALRQRQLCECTIRRYVKKYPKEEPKTYEGPKVTRGESPIWAEQAARIKARMDKIGANVSAPHDLSVETSRELEKLQRRYDRALARARGDA